MVFFRNSRLLWSVLFITGLLQLPVNTLAAQTYRNLALGGGGIRGFAYAGAMAELERRHITDSLQNIAGTSVGAVTAVALGTGYSVDELMQLLTGLKVQQFNDGRWIFFGGISRVLRRYGWYRGEALERWVGRLIERKTGSAHTTFAALHQLAAGDPHFKDLYITATNLSAQEATVFSWRTYPDMEIKTAVRTSMSIPLYYAGVWLDSAGREVPGGCSHCSLYADGGIVLNYPLEIFDSGGRVNRATLGLKLERRSQIDYFRSSDGIAPFRINGFGVYVGALYNIIIETLNRKAPIEDEAPRTIYISTEDVGPRVRKMSSRQKMLLFNSGQKAAASFFAAGGEWLMSKSKV